MCAGNAGTAMTAALERPIIVFPHEATSRFSSLCYAYRAYRVCRLWRGAEDFAYPNSGANFIPVAGLHPASMSQRPAAKGCAGVADMRRAC